MPEGLARIVFAVARILSPLWRVRGVMRMTARLPSIIQLFNMEMADLLII